MEKKRQKLLFIELILVLVHGDIITPYFATIEYDESLNHFIQKTKREGTKLLVKVIEDFLYERIRYKRMEGKGSYYIYPGGKNVI